MVLQSNLHKLCRWTEGVFYQFMDEKGNLKASLRHRDQGLVSLCEASHLAKEGEHATEEATNFTTKQLKSLMEGSLEPHLVEHVAHALELPLNRRMPGYDQWFIEASQREAKMNPVLLELAKLDFNRVQIIYQRELREVSRWWSNLGLAQRLPFSRDRLMENYFWTVGWAFEPQFARFREAQTKGNCLITTIDDVYDVYGTIDELELFTDAVERWDVNTMDKLPEYMKICFLALFNTTNDTAYNVMKEKGLDIIPHLKKAWADLCKAYMVEARWYHQGYTPNLEEFLENALVSISGLLILTLAYCTSDDVSQETLEDFHSCPEIARRSSMILRLCDDLGTSKDELERGDVPKSIQCYMHESGLSEYAARKPKKMIAINIPRMAHCMYQYGDGYGKPDGVIEDRIGSLFIEPILL
ncbi:unnamed protein product [Musa acuminata var. zebrina]